MLVLLPVARLLALKVFVLLLQTFLSVCRLPPCLTATLRPVFWTPACLSDFLPATYSCVFTFFMPSIRRQSLILSFLSLYYCLSVAVPSPSYVFLFFWPSEFLNFLSSGYLSTICTFFSWSLYFFVACLSNALLSVCLLSVDIPYCLSTAVLSVCLLSVNRPPVYLSVYLPQILPPSQSLISTLWYSVYRKKNLQYCRQLFLVHYIFRVLQNIKKAMEFWEKVTTILFNSVEKIACIFRVVLSSRLLYGRPPT